MTLNAVSLIDPIWHLTDSIPDAVTYWYEGRCPRGEWLRLPRTVLIERVARRLMQQLAASSLFAQEGKMYGVLLVETPTGEQQVLKAFSGLLNGKSSLEGWVPPIPGRDRVALEEAQTLAGLNAIQQELITLQHIPERQTYIRLSQAFTTQLEQLQAVHQTHKQERLRLRQQHLEMLIGEPLETALEWLNDQSRREGIARRHLKQNRDAALHPLKQVIDQADARIRQLKLRRKTLSRYLQTQLHDAYSLTNFAGESTSIQQLITSSGLPTGTGDCCAPKLLHYAATHHLKPSAMAEFWWGAATADKTPGQFYGACLERCQPILGFLLSGLSQPVVSSEQVVSEQVIPEQSLSILYEDDWLIAVDKPAGLLSVPGRYRDRQDSVLSRLRQSRPEILAVHRLDQDTSGVLLLAKDQATQRCISQQFQQRQIHKVYEAILVGRVASDQGTIDLPLWSDPTDRPRQKVDPQRGKPSLTQFQVITRTEHFTRIKLMPLTGRTHQLRVHAAIGLATPIWGDRLYGNPAAPDAPSDTQAATRLHLHAKDLKFWHPQTQQLVCLQSQTPF